jgi:hypothetical protein
VDAATGAITTAGTALTTGANGANVVAATNTLSTLVNANGTKTIATVIGITDSSVSIVENINGMANAINTNRNDISDLQTNMITKDGTLELTNKTIDAFLINDNSFISAK